MTLQFTLIYRTSNFAESKALDFETRNVFKKHKLHAQYMTQRKMKVLAKVDNLYKSLLPIHQTLAHSTFVIFVMPTQEAQYKTLEQLNTLITELKKEKLIQNEDFYFVSVIHNGVCVSQEQLYKLSTFNSNTNSVTALNQVLKNPISILDLLIKKTITPLIQNYNYITNRICNYNFTQKTYV